MQLVDCDNFLSSLRNKSSAGLVSLATIEFTTSCNLKCAHCYCTGTAYRELTLEQWKLVANKLYESGCLTIAITGGEPLLRSDFPQFYLYLKEKGFLVCLLTNATLMDEQIICLLREYPPILVDISMYGSKSETYDRVTCSKGFFPLLRSNLDQLKKNQIPFSLKTMILQENSGEIEEIAEIAKTFEVEFRVDPALHPRRNGDKDCFAYSASPEIAARKEVLQVSRREAFSEYFRQKRISNQRPKLHDRTFLCQVDGRKDAAFIRADGGISPCSGLAWCAAMAKPGQTISEALEDFWRHFNASYPVHPRLKKCVDCEYLGLCSFCPASDYPTQDLSMDCEFWYSLNRFREKHEGDVCNGPE